jgi:inorganic pyrophosphatase
VSRPYPFPYGFIIGTTAADGHNLDCYVITQQGLRTGQIVTCEPIGLMEQLEDAAEDHNVLAKLPNESVEITNDIEAALVKFVLNVFRHVKDKRISVGRFRSAGAATAHIRRCLDNSDTEGPA